jgi:hypothetical protein
VRLPAENVGRQRSVGKAGRLIGPALSRFVHKSLAILRVKERIESSAE